MPDLEHEGAREHFFVWSLTPTGKKVRWEIEGTLDTDAELMLEAAADVEARVALRERSGGVALLELDSLVPIGKKRAATKTRCTPIRAAGPRSRGERARSRAPSTDQSAMGIQISLRRSMGSVEGGS